jgi:protein-S-isoprenylcysteine O-methyltransferase Ste14
VIGTVVFAFGSGVIVWVSRRSLLRPRTHGFARFFAFETILALLVINFPHWFVDPLGVRQLVSWGLLAGSIVLVTWGTVLLLRRGHPLPVAPEAPEFTWENTERLVTTGLYGYIRHPMYSSLLFLAWGALLKSLSTGAVLLTGIATLAIVATARCEETENLRRFGQEYRDYMERTHRFVPFVL